MVKLQDVFRKTIRFLEKYKVEYLIIGGVAAAVIGEPRTTGDLDISLSIKKSKIKDFLKSVAKEGFRFEINEVNKRLKETGTFQIRFGDTHIDFIIVSTKFEQSALKRKQRLPFLNLKANFPTPEDLILLKIVPARPLDIKDADNVAIRHKGKLDENYLISWAQKLSDEAEDMRIFQEVKRLLSI